MPLPPERDEDLTSAVRRVVTGAVAGAERAAAPSAAPTTGPIRVGDTVGGIAKESRARAQAAVDGVLDARDHTGNAGVDATLAQFADANVGNPEVTQALEGAAARIKQSPETFINADGSVNQRALADLLTQQFASVGTVAVPGPADGGGSPAPSPAAGGSAGAAGASPTGGGTAGANLGGLGTDDVLAMAFLVLMQAARSARDDLQAIMEGVRAINREQEGWRRVAATIAALAATGTDGDTGKLDGRAVPCGAVASLRAQPIASAVLDGDRLLFNTPGPNCETVAGGLVVQGSDEDSGVRRADLERAKDAVERKLDSLSEMGEMESLRLQMAMDRLSKLMSTLSNLLKKMSDTAAGIIQNLK